MQNVIKAVLFDFGGVIAEEGFWKGLRVIGTENGIDPDNFFRIVDALIYETGYLIGNTDEASFWSTVRSKTGIHGSDTKLRNEILKRFVLRQDMIASVDLLRSKGFIVAMLSDQTNWLDEIDRQTALFNHFDAIFNSYHRHKSKRDSSVFGDVCSALGIQMCETLFVDDNINHIERAQGQGLQTIHFVSNHDYGKRINILL